MTTELTYFDYDGSRGLECRLALTVAGVPFVDRRLSREQWAAFKPNTPFGGMPLLAEQGRTLAHSNAILRLIGRQNGLHPADAWTAAEHDALMDSVEDLRNKIPGSSVAPEARQAAREAFAAGWLSQWARTVEARIAGPFVEGEKLHVVDLKLFVIVRAFYAATYDHIAADFFDAYPKIAGLHAAVAAAPAVRAYLGAIAAKG
ncbi:MAG: glutathione S-transferase family protein [Deltaproteobacteria bacterium]|nr:glutathione S-transferase family protein [Deltaproteobacteria bacterium]